MTLQLGSNGADVRRLEQRLKDLSLYTGSIDGVFGGGVQAAVKAFQLSNSLTSDGVVGPQTWAALFPGTVQPVNTMLSQPVAQRCLALTGSFETSTGVPDCYAGLTGNFDGQGISYGALQWNIGQGTVQPMLTEMIAKHPDVFGSIFHENQAAIETMLGQPRAQQLAWADTIQDPIRHAIFEPWKGMFQALGRTPEFQAIQCANAEKKHQDALSLCRKYGVVTERALALLFDICVQNGSISNKVDTQIRADFAGLAANDEVGRLRSIANRRAEAANPKFVEDVRARKLTIANGEGKVHGATYDLEEQFGIRLQPMAS